MNIAVYSLCEYIIQSIETNYIDENIEKQF